jgi:hypothetical protein
MSWPHRSWVARSPSRWNLGGGLGVPLAGPEEAVKIGERALLVQALRRPVCSRSPRPPPLREFLFRPRHWRLPRCLEIDRNLDVVSNEKSALIESLVPADAIVLAIQRRSHHEGDARTSVSV